MESNESNQGRTQQSRQRLCGIQRAMPVVLLRTDHPIGDTWDVCRQEILAHSRGSLSIQGHLHSKDAGARWQETQP